MVESTSLELFKKPADVALADVGFGGLGSAGRMVGLDLGELLQPEQFYGVGMSVWCVRTGMVSLRVGAAGMSLQEDLWFPIKLHSPDAPHSSSVYEAAAGD